jgi:hypothetical protein
MCSPEHLPDQVAHVFHLVVDVFGQRAVGLLLHHSGDALDLVADALEVRDGLDHGHHQPQIGGSRLPARDDPRAFLVDLHLQRIDPVVVRHHLLGQPGVAGDQRRHRTAELLFHDAAHLQHLVADVLEFLVELTGNVMSEIQLVHVAAQLSRNGP